jgi:hypothetical protein
MLLKAHIKIISLFKMQINQYLECAENTCKANSLFKSHDNFNWNSLIIEKEFVIFNWGSGAKFLKIVKRGGY